MDHFVERARMGHVFRSRSGSTDCSADVRHSIAIGVTETAEMSYLAKSLSRANLKTSTLAFEADLDVMTISVAVRAVAPASRFDCEVTNPLPSNVLVFRVVWRRRSALA